MRRTAERWVALTERGLARAMYEVMSAVAEHPELALPAARRRGHGVVVDRTTDLLIEGYPRSGNSFAVAALRAAQPQPVRIAHHIHAPAHVIAAVRMHVPALVVIREPTEAVREFVAVKPSLTAGQALRGYVRFYGPLVRHRRGFVVARYEEVTTDFGVVTRRINQRFGSSFREFEHTEENVATVFLAMDRYWREREGPGLPLVGRTPPADRRPEPAGGTEGTPRPGRLAPASSAPVNGTLAKAEALYRLLTGERRAG